MGRTDDLSTLFAGVGGNTGPGPGFVSGATTPQVAYHQGIVIEFNNDTGANRIDVGGTELEDLAVIGEVEPLGIQPGDVVGVLRVNNAWMVLGRVRVSGGASPGGGIQYHGGPVPPVPTTPTVTPIFQGLKVAWDGLFDAGAERTVDWSRVEVHVSSSAANAATQQLTFDGGTDGATVAVGGDIIAASSTYTAAGAIHGPLAMRSTNTQFIRVQNSGTATHSGSVYVRIPDAQASGAARLVTFTNSANGNLANIRINNLLQVQIADSVNSPQNTSTVTGTTGQVMRIDWQWDDSVAGSLAAPVITVRVFLDPDATEHSDSITWTAAGLATAQNRWVLGALSSTVAWVSHLDTFRANPGLTWLAPYSTSFIPDTSTFRASIESPDGGQVTLAFVPDAPIQYVRLVSRSLAGKSSDPSTQTSGTPGTVEEFIGDIGSGTRIFYGPDTPVDPVEGELWYHETGVGTGLYIVERYVGGVWEPLDLEGVADAIAEAIAAQQQVRLHAQDEPPAGVDHVIGDLWVDTNDGRRLYAWDGDSWEPHQFGNGAIEPGSLIASNVIATGTISTALLEAQAVTADKMAVGTITAESAIIAEAAIVNANIADLNAGKIQAGTLGADVVIGGKISTAAIGARVEMDSEGFLVYDATNNVAVYILPDNMSSPTTTYLNAAASFVSTPDDPSLDISFGIDLRAKVSLDNWVPGTYVYLLGKSVPSTQMAYSFSVHPSGYLRIAYSPNGSQEFDLYSTVTTGFPAGSTHWVRVTFAPNNGFSGKTATFYTSNDGVAWTQLGSEVIQAGTTSMSNSTSLLTVAARGATSTSAGSSPGLPGRVYQAEVRSGIGGTVVANPDFTTRTPGATSFVDGTGKTWTLGAGANIISQPGGGVPELGVQNLSAGSQVRLFASGGESVVGMTPPASPGRTWIEGQLHAAHAVSGTRPSITMLSPTTDRVSSLDERRARMELIGNSDITNVTELYLEADQLYVTGNIESTGFLRSTRASATSGALAARVTADLDDRFLIRMNGQLRWGAGTGAQDTFLERAAAGNLATTAMLTSQKWHANVLGAETVSTTWAAGVSCGTSFTAPSTGQVRITVGGIVTIRSGNSAQQCYLGFRVGTGSTVGAGTEILSADEQRALRCGKPATADSVPDGTDRDASIEANFSYLVTGLTAGTVYNVQTRHRRTGGNSGTVAQRTVWVEPW